MAASVEVSVPLTGTLLSIELAFECPHCEHPTVELGRWFKTIRQFTCEGCDRDILVTYRDKVVLFEKHAPRQA